MSTGSVEDCKRRIEKLLPPWFGEKFPLLNALLVGYATLDSFIYFLTQYLYEQLYIQTATARNLDLIACDYYENILSRTEGMSDEQFRKLIQGTLLQEEATLNGMSKAIKLITGHTPIIIEWFGDISSSFWNISNFWSSTTFYGGGPRLAYNFWITVFVDNPAVKGTAFWNSSNTWFNGNIISNSYYSGKAYAVLTYEEILEVVNRVKVAGTVPHLTLMYI